MMLRDSQDLYDDMQKDPDEPQPEFEDKPLEKDDICLLYTSDAADE